jgi:hypothetical protein
MRTGNAPTDNTAVSDCHDPEFAATDQELLWRDDQGRHHTSIIYQPSRAAVNWDLGEDHPAVTGPQPLRCLGSRYGSYCFVSIRDRSRGETPVPYFGGYGRRVTVEVVEFEPFAACVIRGHIRTRPGF